MASNETKDIALLSIHPEFANAILRGEKRVEFRKTRMTRPVKMIALYATSPIRKIVALCQVLDTHEASPETIWKRYHKKAGIKRAQFMDYFDGNARGIALVLGEVTPLEVPLRLARVSRGFKPPQSFVYVPRSRFASALAPQAMPHEPLQSIRHYVLLMEKIQDERENIRLCDHFLDVAREFRTVKWGLSREFARFYDCESQLCFENCQRIAKLIPALQYHEGFVSVLDIVEAHAWLVDETGEVIDPTLGLNVGFKKGVEGYMGIHIPIDYVEELFLKDFRRDTRIEQAFADGQW